MTTLEATTTSRPQAVSRRSASRAQRKAARTGRGQSKPWLVHLTLLCVCVLFVAPFVWMVSTSLKTVDQVMKDPPVLIPRPMVPGNYWSVITHPKMDFPLFTRNTLIVATLCVIGTVLSSSIVAYGFAKVRFRGRGLLFALMLSTMMIPGAVLMVPQFALFRWLGDHTPIQFLGTFKPLWIGAFFGSAFNIFLLRQFFMTIPDDLSEAARIDGCSELGIFTRIMLPLARPALAVVALFTFMAVWNDFLGPLVYLQRPEQYTLALGLQTFQSQHGGTEWQLLMAASVLVLAPIVILFFLAQRTFIQGIATTGMKG
jgi:multiple sugar transport system permease protein